MENSSSATRFEENIKYLKDKIEYNAIGKYYTVAKNCIKQFGETKMPSRIIIEKDLVEYMKSLSRRFSKISDAALEVAEKWQQQVDLSYKENNRRYSHSPWVNGSCGSNPPPTISSDRRNRHHSYIRNCASPLQTESPGLQTSNSVEYNANLSIDPREIIPSNTIQDLPSKPNDRFYIALKEKMFRAVQLKEPALEENLSLLLHLCKDVLKLKLNKYPDYLRDYMEYVKTADRKVKEKLDSFSCNKYLREKVKKKVEPNLPSKSQQETVNSSTNGHEQTCPESGHDRKRRHLGNTQAAVKAKELKEEQKPAQSSRLKLDVKLAHTTAQEARNCDRNNIKKTDSPDESAMIAITSSKKERTSVYHGRKCEVSKLKDMCIRTIVNKIQRSCDGTKYINKNVSIDVLEPILTQLSPKKLHKLEDEKKFLSSKTDHLWMDHCKKHYRPQIHLKKDNESWHAFYQKCLMESREKLKNLTASISASASKVRHDRQTKFTTVDGPPTKRQKSDIAATAKNNVNTSKTIKVLPNSTHPPNSKCVAVVPLKVPSNNIKPSQKPVKRVEAPLMHKVKKTMGQYQRLHRS